MDSILPKTLTGTGTYTLTPTLTVPTYDTRKSVSNSKKDFMLYPPPQGEPRAKILIPPGGGLAPVPYR